MSAAPLTPAEQGALWRQRLFEAHSAMTAYLIQEHRAQDLADWVDVTGRIFHDLPPAVGAGSTEWQAVFFRTQALIEQFIVQRKQVYDLDAWAAATGQVYRALEPAGQGEPAAAAERLGAPGFALRHAFRDSPGRPRGQPIRGAPLRHLGLPRACPGQRRADHLEVGLHLLHQAPVFAGPCQGV